MENMTNIDIEKLKEAAKNPDKVEKTNIKLHSESKVISKECDSCKEIIKIEEFKAKTNNPKAFAIYKLVELFSANESGEKAKGRNRLLIFCMIFISIIFIFEVGLVILQGLNIIKLQNIVFLGTIGTIMTAIIFILKLIAKYLYNNESDKILKTIEKVIENL